VLICAPVVGDAFSHVEEHVVGAAVVANAFLHVWQLLRVCGKAFLHPQPVVVLCLYLGFVDPVLVGLFSVALQRHVRQPVSAVCLYLRVVEAVLATSLWHVVVVAPTRSLWLF
jgi:hypothetical protein